MSGQKFTKPKLINAKLRLRRINYANFVNFYHKGTNDDFLYKYLTKLISHELSSCPNVKSNFKSNFNFEGFYFKTKDFVKCKNLSGKVCLLSDLLDHDVIAKLQITPYDFTSSTGQHLSGLSILLLEAKAASFKV